MIMWREEFEYKEIAQGFYWGGTAVPNTECGGSSINLLEFTESYI